MPWSVRTPSAQCCVRVRPPRPEPGAARVVGADLEPGREDQAVELVLDPVDDDAALGDALHAPPVRVDERDVRTVERLQVVVVEARPLAELAVPRLERVGGRGVLHDRVDARADLLHLQEVGGLEHLGDRLGRQVRVAFAHGDGEQLAGDVGPAVGDEILFGPPARGERLEVLDAPPLPAGLERRGPLGIGGSVGAHVDR